MDAPPFEPRTDDLATLARLAQAAHDAADHEQARALYQQLCRQHPDNPIIRRNELVSLEYDPTATPQARLQKALAWGAWATNGQTPARPSGQPNALPLGQRPLRVGYVSADICQHTVGFLVKDVITHHHPERVTTFVYSAGAVEDWVTRKIARAVQFRNVQALDDAALADQIKADAIDVLVDLSGHTAGSRLSVFALRPAPVQISWLGYFATTGLNTIDAVLLDPWHHTPEIAASFCERIIDLPSRFCYQPAPFAPEVSPPPVLERGYVTFGSFNNSAKLNTPILQLWAEILSRCPDTRLILKWRTLEDPALRQKIRQIFTDAGIQPNRLELRGASFHADVLKEYADIDIALDPFPFCGGLTTCEALWMGLPVITLPQDRAVSRQTTAILNLIGHTEWIASSPVDYVRIATQLASDPEPLAVLRHNLRSDMVRSPLMDLNGFIKTLEDTLYETVSKITPLTL